MTNAPPPPNWNAPAPASGPAPYGYGGFWIRVFAYVIDSILLSIATGVLALIAGVNIFMGNTGNFGLTTNLISIAIGWLYFALMESSQRGATVGKMAVGVRVVTGAGEQLSFLNATGRYFAKIISALILLIGFIMVAFTERKRGLHDMIADTLVIKTR